MQAACPPENAEKRAIHGRVLLKSLARSSAHGLNHHELRRVSSRARSRRHSDKMAARFGGAGNGMKRYLAEFSLGVGNDLDDQTRRR